MPMAGVSERVWRTCRRLNRSRQVAGVLAKHGFGDALRWMSLDRRLAPFLRRVPHPEVLDEASRPARVRAVLAELGPTFVKAGQYLSTRADLVPEAYRAELSRLQDDVPPFPGEEARRLVESELGAPARRAFARFSIRPLAAASLAQVHEAELRDGTSVVVKVQRPGAAGTVAADLEILGRLAAAAERRSPAWRERGPGRVVDELARTLDRELDLSIEAAHVERFARQFAGRRDVRVPAVYRALSTPRVLTLERLKGVKIDDLHALRRAGIDPRAAAAALASQYLDMIFTHGFFHADPHPGNLLVLPGPVIAYLDFGMTGRLGRAARESLADAVHAVAGGDERSLARALLSLARCDEAPDAAAFEADVAELMDQYAFRPVGEWRLGRMFEQLFRTTARHRVRVPPELFLMVKALSEVESLTGSLDPAFDAVSAAAPFVRAARERRLSPARAAEELSEAGREALGLLRSAPADLRELLRRALRGRLLVEFEHKGLEPALAALEQASNRLAYALLLGALVLGSSLLARDRAAGAWRELGAAGFVLSGAMALWLLAAIRRHGRL